MSTPDITVNDQGTVVGFTFETPAAKRWVDEAVSNEGWQWMGDTLWVDHRSAQFLVDVASGAGFEIGGAA